MSAQASHLTEKHSFRSCIQTQSHNTLTLILEVEEGCKLAALVVATKHEERFGVGDLEGIQIKHDFRREAATIDVVTKEKVPAFV